MLIVDYPPFRPFPTLQSAHAQTLGAYFFQGPQPKYQAVKKIVPLFDGDRLVVHDDQPESWITGDRIVIFFHGLCGSHRSPYVARTAKKLNRQGIRTFRVDMRGFGDSALISKSHLHGGCYQDAEAVIRFVNRISPISKISLVGYSIGGNIILKTMGRWGDSPMEPVDSAIAISPPIDLIHASWNLRRFGNRVYESYFMSRLKSQLSMRRKHVKDLVDNQINPLPTRLIHWDDQFTAPCWGHSGARDYYEQASSREQVKNVTVPTIILAAQDDPVVPFSMFSAYPMSDYIDLVSTKKGGHLGYIGKRGKDPDRYWMDWRICEWITSLDSFVSSTSDSTKSDRGRGPHRPRSRTRQYRSSV